MKKLLIGLTLVSSIFASSIASASEIVVNGSTTVLPIMQKAAEAFMRNNPSVTISITGAGSGNGIKALMESTCDIAMASRDIKASEVEGAKRNGVDPFRIVVAYDALVPVVHPSNTVQNLTVQQLQDIYAGKITDWKEVGGKPGKIVVISRETSSGTYETWGDLIMKKIRITPRAQSQASSGGVVTAIGQNPRAIGYVGFGYLNQAIKPLAVGGVVASATAVNNNEWPIARELYLFTNGQPTGDAKRLVDFILDPKKGQKIVSEVGYIPL